MNATAAPLPLEREKESQPDDRATLLTFAEQALAEWRLPPGRRANLMQALDEALTNVAMYAYPDDCPGPVRVRLSRVGRALELEIVDRGRPFDPTRHPAPDITAPLERRPVGGLGIHLMRCLVSGMRYRRHGRENHLVLVCDWDASGGEDEP